MQVILFLRLYSTVLSKQQKCQTAVFSHLILLFFPVDQMEGT